MSEPTPNSPEYNGASDEEGANTPEWVPDEVLANLNLERQVHPSETEEELAKRLLKEALPTAAAGLVHLAMHSGNERTRLDAQKYIIERNMGKIGDPGGTDDSPWEHLLAAVVTNTQSVPSNS